jgi:dTDP-4-amino-4,6-dideoxygalactose transaminase
MIDYLNLQQVTAMHRAEIHDAVASVIDSGWYLQGEATRRFEADYAAYIGTRHCVGCGNGLDALTLIFRAYKEMGFMKEGDEVIVPANTYIASILSITENGLVPVLVEPWGSTLEINETLIEQAITEKTRALLLVHLYGRNAWTPGIQKLCDHWRLRLVEDNAQAQGVRVAQYGMTGSLGHAAAHSFYPGKNLGALGDGGAVTTDDDELASVVRALGNYGSSEKYVFPYQGRNSRLDDIQAAVLGIKLKYLDADNARRRQIAGYYYQHVTNPELFLPGKRHGNCQEATTSSATTTSSGALPPPRCPAAIPARQGYRHHDPLPHPSAQAGLLPGMERAVAPRY